MLLEPLGPGGVGLRKDGAGQEHADGLPPDQAGADHPPPDGAQVGGLEPPGRQVDQPVVPGHHHPQVPQEGPGRLASRGIPRRSTLGPHPLLEELPVPEVQGPGDGVRPAPVVVAQHLRKDRALGDGLERLALPPVRQVHRGRVAPVDLQRVDVHPLLVAEDVDQDLRRAADGRDAVDGVPVAKQREIGERLHLVEVGAGDHEEVAEHQVAVPVGGQVRQAVEDVAGALPRLLDHLVDPGREGLEPRLGVQAVDFRPAPLRHQLRVAGEPEVHEAPLRGERRCDEGPDEGLVVVDRLHLPDDVVAGQQAVEDAVQERHPRVGLENG